MHDWGFALPMASAILTVLWPEEFTVYDVRARGELNDFSTLGSVAPHRVWPEYVRYREAVRQAVPGPLSLRDKDRTLFGRSMARQLVRDLQTSFSKPDLPTEDSVVSGR